MSPPCRSAAFFMSVKEKSPPLFEKTFFCCNALWHLVTNEQTFERLEGEVICVSILPLIYEEGAHDAMSDELLSPIHVLRQISPTSAMRCSDRHIFGLVLRSLATSRQRPFAQHAAHNSANAQ